MAASAKLKVEVEARYSAVRIRQWTNPQKQGTDGKDDGRFDKAICDVQSDFRIYAGKDFDEDDEDDINIASEGVIAKLRLRADHGGEFAEEEHNNWRKSLRALARVTSRDRILAEATFRTDREQQEFQDERFGDLVPNPPRRTDLRRPRNREFLD